MIPGLSTATATLRQGPIGARKASTMVTIEQGDGSRAGNTRKYYVERDEAVVQLTKEEILLCHQILVLSLL